MSQDYMSPFIANLTSHMILLLLSFVYHFHVGVKYDKDHLVWRVLMLFVTWNTKFSTKLKIKHIDFLASVKHLKNVPSECEVAI